MLVLNGEEYGLAFTIGAAVSINDLYPDGAPKGLRAGRYVMDLALIMSREYENRMALSDPEYKRHPLTKELLYSLDQSEAASIDKEVTAAYLAGSKRSVETKPLKNQTGTVSR